MGDDGRKLCMKGRNRAKRISAIEREREGGGAWTEEMSH